MDKLDVVADRGYCDGGEIKACVEAGITPYVPKSNTSANRKLGLFGKDVFRYDAAHLPVHLASQVPVRRIDHEEVLVGP